MNDVKLSINNLFAEVNNGNDRNCKLFTISNCNKKLPYYMIYKKKVLTRGGLQRQIVSEGMLK